MPKEKLELSPIENELLFQLWCKRKGVDLFLLDGDDTIWQIQNVFRQYLSECYGFLTENVPCLNGQQWKEIITQTDNAAFEKHSVNPLRWFYTMDEVANKTSLRKEIRDKAKKIIMQIYQTPPQFFEGSERGLEFLNKCGIPFGIVTHANVDWTRQKFQWLKLDRFLDWEMVYIVDENRHKTTQSWQEAISYFGSQPERSAVIGDSPRSDINPARQAGVKHCFLVRGHIEIWSVHNQPVDPQTITISSLEDLIGLGQEYLHEFRPQKTITK